MPRVEPGSSKGTVVVYEAPSLTAAATLMSGATSSNPKKKNKSIRRQAWQMRAWEWYDEIGEYRFSVVWVGNMLSKAKLHVVGKDGKPTKDKRVIEIMDQLFGGPEEQVEMLRQLGIHFTVAGEAYLIGEDGKNGEKWQIAAATEVSESGNVWRVGRKELKKPLVVRLFRPHPRNADDSDSPSRAVLPILAEIDGLTKHVAAQIDSRLAGAGLLLVPQEISSAAVQTSGVDENGDPVSGATTTDSTQQILTDLMTAMMTAIGNREDASALVPIILQGPGEHLDKIRHLTFSTELDKMSIELRAEAIRRLALGMDMPPEVLTGTAEMNHWGSWQIEEASIKSHTEPLLATITAALTTGYLRPVLESDGFADAADYKIVADTTAMRLRPNRSKEALELYDRGLLSIVAALRENGFEPDDEMDEKGLAQWLTKKIATGSSTPEMVDAAAALLGVMLPKVVVAEIEEEKVTEERPTPSLQEHPSRELPDAAVAASEVIVFRALERAGNRLKSRKSDQVARAGSVAAADLYLYVDPLESSEIDDLLTDAWSCMERFDSTLAGVSRHSLDGYTRRLLMDRRKHDSGNLKGFLDATALLEISDVRG